MTIFLHHRRINKFNTVYTWVRICCHKTNVGFVIKMGFYVNLPISNLLVWYLSGYRKSIVLVLFSIYIAQNQMLNGPRKYSYIQAPDITYSILLNILFLPYLFIFWSEYFTRGHFHWTPSTWYTSVLLSSTYHFRKLLCGLHTIDDKKIIVPFYWYNTFYRHRKHTSTSIIHGMMGTRQ